ncbi:MAG TPA: Rrf2 family transcriptional regulator [Rhizobium sp.]
MRLSKQSEIAIGILAICAGRPTERIRTQGVADLTSTTKDHAAQIVALLVRHGFLSTVRGRRGGLQLAMAPVDINLGSVLRVTQPELASVGDGARLLAASGNSIFGIIVEAAFASFLALMDHFTVSDLIALPPSPRLACLDCSLVNPAHRTRMSMSSPSSPQSFDRHRGWPAMPTLADRSNQERKASDVFRLPS